MWWSVEWIHVGRSVAVRESVLLLGITSLVVYSMASDTSQDEYIISVKSNPNVNAAENDQRLDTLTKSLHTDIGFEVLRQFRIGKYRAILVQDKGGCLTKLHETIASARSKSELSSQERVLVESVGSIEPNQKIHAAAAGVGKAARAPPGGAYTGPVRTPYMQMPNRPSHSDSNKEVS